MYQPAQELQLGLLDRLVLGEDLVERAAGLGEDPPGLVGVAGGDALHCRPADLEHQAADVHGALVHAALDGVPGLAEVLAVVRDVRTARLGELVGAAALLLLGETDQALVLELLERRVHRAGARLPDAVRAALDLLDELVAVLRRLLQQDEHGGADVAAPGATPAAAAAAAPARSEEERLELARVAAERAAGPPHHVPDVLPAAAV